MRHSVTTAVFWIGPTQKLLERLIRIFGNEIITNSNSNGSESSISVLKDTLRTKVYLEFPQSSLKQRKPSRIVYLTARTGTLNDFLMIFNGF